jgi:endonuclease YncB( thermonuclease family)
MPVSLFLFAAGTCSVIDADTLKCGGRRLRLARINAVELSEPGGPKARDFLRLLVDGKAVTCTWSRTDRWARPIAECWTEPGLSLSDQVRKAGHAKIWRATK